MSLRSTPVCSLSKIVYVAVILLLHGRSKKSDTLWSMGDIDWKCILVMLIYFNTENSENSICRCYTFATGSFKINLIHCGQWAIFIELNFSNFNLKWKVRRLNRKL
jgi:hypothetical protein